MLLTTYYLAIKVARICSLQCFLYKQLNVYYVFRLLPFWPLCLQLQLQLQ